MTEHTKIEPAKRSLFERAEEFLGKHSYTPPPVPRKLAAPVNRRPTQRVAQRPVSQPAFAEPTRSAAPAFAPMPAAPMPAAPAAAAPVAAAPFAAAPAAPKPIANPVHFREDKLHRVDRRLLARNGLIQPEAQVSELLEEFRIVKRRVLASVRTAREAGSGAMAQRVLVCSPHSGEGKSYCAANLALAMAAEKDGEVLLVDADFAKPSQLKLFGLPRGPGFMDVLANPDIRLEDCILATDIAGLHVLPAGNHTNSDSEYLASSRTAVVLDMLTQASPNRIVIFDSSPALAASPAAELAHHVGQAIVVARADRTGQGALEDALTLLSACPDLKLLLNAAHFSPSGRRFGSYYGQEA